MKNKSALILLISICLLTGCTSNQPKDSGGSGTSSSGSQEGGQTGGNNDPVKTEVKAHTLSDSKPSGLNLSSLGEKVSEETWNSFKYHNENKYSGYYNYTYTATVNYTRTIEKFTKNGYYAETYYGKTYYERISGNKCYSYAAVNDGLLRSETSFDITSRCKSTFENEIYLHMFDYEEYEYDEYDGCYWSFNTSYAAAVKFQNGYLTYLHYSLSGTATYDIEAVFDTSISIPKSYYYK